MYISKARSYPHGDSNELTGGHVIMPSLISVEVSGPPTKSHEQTGLSYIDQVALVALACLDKMLGATTFVLTTLSRTKLSIATKTLH